MDDCAGELALSDERMLVNVVPRSLPEPHPDEKREEPKGLEAFR